MSSIPFGAQCTSTDKERHKIGTDTVHLVTLVYLLFTFVYI